MTPDERNGILWPQAIHHTPALLTWFTAGAVITAEVRDATRAERFRLWLRRMTAWCEVKRRVT